MFILNKKASDNSNGQQFQGTKGKISKKQKKEYEAAKKTGILIENPPFIDNNKKVYFVLVNSLLNFLVVTGTVGCFVKSFDIKCNLFLVIFAAAIIAFMMGSIYFNKITKVVGYIGSFLLFLFVVMNYGLLVRGGFAHISNKMMEFMQDKLDLPIERSYDVYGYNEKISVTVSVIFIIFCVMLMFNMAISETKGFVVIFMFTFPIVQLGIYFDTKINIPFFMIYMTGLISLAFLRNSTHYRMEYKKRKGYKGKKHKNTITYNYVNDGKHSLFYVVSIGIIMLVFSIAMCLIMPQNKYEQDVDKSEWKESTKDFARQFALVGFWGMVNPNGNSAGGVGRNKMGTSKYVKMDYTTDLIVRMPVMEEDKDLYLKSFNGAYYDDAYWYTLEEKDKIPNEEKRENLQNLPEFKDIDVEMEKIYDMSSTILNSYLEEEVSNYTKKLEVVNVAASNDFYYVPYFMYGLFEEDGYTEYDDVIKGGLQNNWKEETKLYTFNKIKSIDAFSYAAKNKKEEMRKIFAQNEEYRGIYDEEDKYYQYVKDVYMDVPEENIESIERFCEEYDLSADSENIVEKVQAAFREDFEYTLMPGRTPKNKEFVNYFLDKQKKGYCVYYATASTLIFRYLGIPARYTGGYVFFVEDYSDGRRIQEQVDEWVYETDDYSAEDFYGVYEFELTDANAHAWVEIYIEGFGWIPVETTPPSEEDTVIKEEENQNNNIMSYLSENIFTSENIKTVRDTTAKFMIICMLAAVIVVIMFIGLGFFIRKKRRYNKNTFKVYENMCKAAAAAKIKKGKEETFEHFGKRISDAGYIDEAIITRINYVVEKEKYSGKMLTKEEVEFVQENALAIINAVYEDINFIKKFVYKYIKWV